MSDFQFIEIWAFVFALVLAIGVLYLICQMKKEMGEREEVEE